MKYIQSLFVTASVLLACLPLHAQWAGENKKLLHKDDNSQQVEIGVPDSDPGRCYEWSGPNILTDIHQPVITVNPQNAINTYRVIRRSTCGAEEDEVIVSVVDSIIIKSVTPLRGCYNEGDSIPRSDFEIETDPPGYESLVTYSPQKADNNWLFNQETEKIIFSLTFNHQTSTKEVTVNVYNESLAISVATPSIHLSRLLKGLNCMQGMVKKVKSFSDMLNKKISPLAPALGPCEPLFDLAITPLDYHYFKACCDGEDVTGFKIMGLAFAPRIGVDCYFDTPWSIPHIGGIHAHLGLSAGINLGPISYTFKGDCAGWDPIPFEIYGDISIGGEVNAINRDVLSAQVDAVASATASIPWDVDKGFHFTGLRFDLVLLGKITFMSFVRKEVKIPLGSYTFFNN